MGWNKGIHNIDKELVSQADGAINPSGSDKCDYGNHLGAFIRGVVELVDTPDLGSGAFRVWVRVPPPRQIVLIIKLITKSRWKRRGLACAWIDKPKGM